MVLSSAVLHFARDDDHFEAMLRGHVADVETGRFVLLPLGIIHWSGAQVKPIAPGPAAVSCCPTDPSGIWWMRRC